MTEINGNRYQFSDVVCTLNGIPIEGIKSIEYGEPNELRNPPVQPPRRITFEGKCEFDQVGWDGLVALFTPRIPRYWVRRARYIARKYRRLGFEIDNQAR